MAVVDSLLERVKLSLLYYGNGIVENFKNNSLFFYEKYKNSDKDVESINIKDIYPGGFYFFHYKDDSNWMKYSPVFVVDYKKFEDKVILFAVNFNFIPLEIRAQIFDKYIKPSDFVNNTFIKTNYEGMYKELLNTGFEYSLMEFNAVQLVLVHRIHLELLPRFLYAQHPINKYDPKKLIEIWSAKLSRRDERHKEIISSVLSDFYDVNNEISEKYNVLKDHIKRLQTSLNKYGKR
jgi:hypothetical protein